MSTIKRLPGYVHQNKSLPGFVHQKVNDKLHVLKSDNYNTNVGIYIDKDGIVLVDPMTGDNNHKQLLSAINKISTRPIKYVINTHSHLDHSGANSFFATLGATIISQENAR